MLSFLYVHSVIIFDIVIIVVSLMTTFDTVTIGVSLMSFFLVMSHNQNVY